MSVANLTVRFGCEIAALVAFVWWGWPFLGVLVAVGVAVVWGGFIGPKSARRLHDPLRLLVELVIFAAATAAWWAAGHHVTAVVFAVLALGSALLVRRWPEPVGV